MSEIVNDWIDFCEDRKKFDKSHFHTLFWEEITQTDLDNIFKYFPNSIELVNQTRDYLFGKKETIADSAINNVLMDLVKKDLKQKKTVINENTDLVDLLESIEIKFTHDYNSVIQLKSISPYIDFFDSLNDKLSNNWIIEDKKAFALYEAFYGLTKNYEMVWYLFNPLFKIKMNCEFYFKLSTLGGVYSFSNDKILVSKRF